MITGPTVAPIGELSDSAGPTAGTISVELEEMPAIADGLDIVSRTCADRTMPILGIATETRFFLGINGRAQQAAALCTGLAADLGMSAAKFGVTAAAVRAAHSSYQQVENTVAGWFESMGIAKDGKLPDGRSTRDHFSGLIAGEPGEAEYLIKLTIPEIGYFSASWMLPYSPVVAGIIFGFTAYMDAKLNPEIARQRIAGRLSVVTKIPQEFIEKVLAVGGIGIVGPLRDPDSDKKAHNMRTASADEYGVSAHSGEKDRLTVDASAERLQAAAKAQDQEFARSQQDPTKGERGAVLVTVMYEAGHEGDPAHALYVVSIPGTNFSSLGGSPIDPAGAMRETLGEDTTGNPAYQMVLQALRDAGAPQGARVYMEGFSQGAMIAYNMANSLEVAKEFNIVGIYAQGTPLRGLPAKRRGFAVDYVEGEGDWVPDSAWREDGWRPDDRDTAITVQNPVHHGENYREALEREGHSNAVFGGMRAALDGKDYVVGEQKVTSGSAMPDGYSSAERKGVTLTRLGTYADQAYKSGVRFDEKGIDEAIEQGTGGKVKGLQDIRNRVERVQQTAEYAGEKFNKTLPAVIEGVKKTLPHPEPTPQEKPQAPKPAWPETPVLQMPKMPLLQGYSPQNIPPAINMPGDLNRPEPAPINMPARIEAEGSLPPAGLIPPDILPKPADLHTHIEKAVTQPIIDYMQLPNAGSVLQDPFLGPRQGGDYDGGESLIPTLPHLKPAPMLPPKSIDPGFLVPAPPENIDPGFRAPGPPEDLNPLEEREPLMV